ncbi:Uncharacterised protein [Serratia liquefaciens]|nr:Uncharacterised protein [Serratia liquefaciens]
MRKSVMRIGMMLLVGLLCSETVRAQACLSGVAPGADATGDNRLKKPA